MQKNFHTRKVKFYIIERTNIEIPKIKSHLDPTYDMYDIEEKMWKEFSHRATDDYGYMNRPTPKVQLGWSHLISNKDDFFQFKIHKLSDVIKEVDAISTVNTHTPFLLLSQIIKDSLPKNINEENANNEDNLQDNHEIYREKILIPSKAANDLNNESLQNAVANESIPEAKVDSNNENETKPKLKINAKITQK